MEELSLIRNEEVPALINYLDPENKGYVDFKEFNKKIRSNMAQQDEQGQATVLPYVVPSKKIHEKVAQGVADTKKKVDELKKSYEPLPYDLKPSTRYGSSPNWKNTFLSFQPASNTQMFVSENERFNRHPGMRTLFQVEERERKNAAIASRIETIKTHTDFFNSKTKFETELLNLRDKTKLTNKNMAQSIYEHKAKLLNGPL